MPAARLHLTVVYKDFLHYNNNQSDIHNLRWTLPDLTDRPDYYNILISTYKSGV